MNIEPHIRKKRGRKKGTSKYDWSKVDWDMGDYAIAKILGCHGSLVTRKRKALHISPAYERGRVNWEAAEIDWAKSDVEIAVELGVSSGAVGNRRRFLGLPPAFLKGEGQRLPSWAEIDNKLSERKTVHEWFNSLKIPQKERGKKLCLLRRTRIACDLIHEQRQQLKEAAFLVTRLLTQDKNASAVRAGKNVLRRIEQLVPKQ